MKVILTEDQLNHLITESVYVNNIKNGKAMIHYKKNSESDTNERSKGILNPAEKLKTDKMDNQNGCDTYEVQLKNGFKCYNITSIHGQQIMRYFKHYFDNGTEPEGITIKNKKTGEKQKYELDMEEREFNEFLSNFRQKVENVVKYHLRKAIDQTGINFKTISIYPVISSSHFNEEMAKRLQTMSICGMNIQTIDPYILNKDLRDLTYDKDFIENNYGYYLSPRSKGESSVFDFVSSELRKNSSAVNAKSSLDNLNIIVSKIDEILAVRNPHKAKQLADLFSRYVTTYENLKKSTEYFNSATNRVSVQQLGKIIKPNEPEEVIVNRTNKILKILQKTSKLKMPLDNNFRICKWVPRQFEIKNTTNGERMGLMNIYRFEDDPEKLQHVQDELNRIRGTLFVLFDDNVSGGATLSDICLQFEKAGGINPSTIVPITFGQMGEKWTVNKIQLYEPVDRLGNKRPFNFTNDPAYSPKYHKEIYEGVEKENLSILWLDDQRDPMKYLNGVNKEQVGLSGAKSRNFIAYKKLMDMYNISFNWVRTFTEFKNYILSNGLPSFISFDKDLGKAPDYDGYNGIDCAKWLSEYCKQNNLKYPKYFIHSANGNAYDGIVQYLETSTLFKPSDDFEFKKDNKRINEEIITETIRNIMVQKVMLNENAIRQIVTECLKAILKENDEMNHDYTEKEMEWLYNNQNNLTPMQRKVLSAGCWMRARKANYQGYDKRWPNISVKDGVVYYYDMNGKLRRIGT